MIFVEKTQVLHTDASKKDVDRRARGGGSGTTSRVKAEPPSYSAVLAFQDDTVLHVIEGSHLDMGRPSWDWGDAKELQIPKGFGVVFNSGIAHAGGSYLVANGRIHLYLIARNGSKSVDGWFKLVASTGKKPDAK